MAETASKKRKSDAADAEHTQDSDSRSGSTEPVKSAEYYDEDGDLEILSSDNVLFKVHKYHLQGVSTVFRTMISAATSSRLELCDATIENAVTLTDLLDVIIHDRDNWRSTREGQEPCMERGCNLLALIGKYDCGRARSQFLRHLESALCEKREFDSMVWPRPYVFALASIMDRYDLSMAALIAASNENWPTPEEATDWDEQYTELDWVPGAPVTDPSTMPLCAFRAISNDYAWIWMRAYRNVFGSIHHGKPSDVEDGLGQTRLSTEFYRLYDIIQGVGPELSSSSSNQ